MPMPSLRIVERERISYLVLTQGTETQVFLNACPHQGTPLENPLGRVLDDAGAHLVCSTHGARFRLSDGFCVAGICQGLSLRVVHPDDYGRLGLAGEIAAPTGPLNGP